MRLPFAVGLFVLTALCSLADAQATREKIDVSRLGPQVGA